jgi:curved DNA-binding protein CbpA
MFSLIAHAYDVLSDPVKRINYNIERGFIKISKESVSEFHRNQKQQALQDISLMKVTYKTKREAEKAANGVIITSAKYGSLKSYVPSQKSIQKAAVGRIIDAKVQLQCMVDKSTLYIEGGSSKIYTCRGLYNPCTGSRRDTVKLCVRYDFHGLPHQVIVSDEQELKIPMRAHQLSLPSASQKLRKKRRRSSTTKVEQAEPSEPPPPPPPSKPLNVSSLDLEEVIREKDSGHHLMANNSPSKKEANDDDNQSWQTVTTTQKLFVASVVTTLAAGIFVYLFTSRRR